MATIVCTRLLTGVGPCEPVARPGATVGDVLRALAPDFPRLAAYVLDDQGAVRQHVSIFVNGALRPRRSVLQQPVTDADSIHVLQALSGG